MANEPVALSTTDQILTHLNTKSVLNVGGIWGQLGSGQSVMASDGLRFIWSADNVAVIYSQAGKFFMQSASGFSGEVRTAPIIEAGRRSMFMARVAEVEMKVLTGILAGASTVGFAAVIGTEVLEFVMENRENFGKWNRQLKAFLQARAYLKAHAPVLYDKVFDAILRQVYKDVKSNLPHAVTPDIVGFGVGVVIGSVGKKAAAGRFSLLSIAFVVLEQLVIRFSLGVAPGAIKLTEQEYSKMATQIITQMRTAGVILHDADVRKILDEVQRHPREVREALDLLRSAFQSHAKVQAVGR